MLDYKPDVTGVNNNLFTCLDEYCMSYVIQQTGPVDMDIVEKLARIHTGSLFISLFRILLSVPFLKRTSDVEFILPIKCMLRNLRYVSFDSVQFEPITSAWGTTNHSWKIDVVLNHHHSGMLTFSSTTRSLSILEKITYVLVHCSSAVKQMPQRMRTHYDNVPEDVFIDTMWLELEIKQNNPRTLQEICCKTIKETMRNTTEMGYESLGLPPQLQEFVSWEHLTTFLLH